jgi:hypothetical protein
MGRNEQKANRKLKMQKFKSPPQGLQCFVLMTHVSNPSKETHTTLTMQWMASFQYKLEAHVLS